MSEGIIDRSIDRKLVNTVWIGQLLEWKAGFSSLGTNGECIEFIYWRHGKSLINTSSSYYN